MRTTTQLLAFFLLFQNYIFSTTYTVTSTAEGTTVDGVSLRWAITQANGNAGADIINFNFGIGGPFTIALTSPLPALTDNSGVLIDGWDNSGNNGTANSVAVFSATASTPLNAAYKIIITGNNAAASSYFTCFTISSNNNTIRGICFKSFQGTATTNYFNNLPIYITGNSNSILGCYIGMNENGTTQGGGKTGIGIYINGASIGQGQNNIIGNGTAAGANLISGFKGPLDYTPISYASGFQGIRIWGQYATGNTIKGNIIGLQKNGESLVAGSSQLSGINIDNSATNNQVGGSVAGEGNVISGNIGYNNAGYGVSIGSSVGNNRVMGNIIGTCADGSTNVSSNGQNRGIYLSDSPNNTISFNTISGNLTYGVWVQGASTNTTIVSNYIGTNKTGTAIITSASQDYGIGIAGTSYATIGGTGVSDGNVISGNTSNGIYLTSTGTGSTIIQNIIGPQADGNTFLASSNQGQGIQIDNSPGHTIGGNTSSYRNIISGNTSAGVYITNASSSGNIIKGNYIGTNSTGTAAVGSQLYGIHMSSAGANTIGGTSSAFRNVISGNTTNGIYLLSSNSSTIIANYIGVDAAGTGVISSQNIGINFSSSNSNIIGGTTVGERNVISANVQYGVYMGSSSSNIFRGNYIGPASDLSNITGDTQLNGFYLFSANNSNIIGGTTSSETNIVSYNSNIGVAIRGSTGGGQNFNTIRRNLTYGNGSKSIDLGGPGNESKASPVFSDWSTTVINGTTTQASDIIEIYKNTVGAASDYATTYVGTTTASAVMNGGGTYDWTYSPSGLTANVDYILATATNTNGSTSEFGKPGSVVTLPISLVNFTAECVNGNKVTLNWTTDSEINNDYFTVERSSDGVNNKSIVGIVKGAGTSTSTNTYSLVDDNPLSGISYYQLKQTDFNGKFEYFKFQFVQCDEIMVNPNPTIGNFILTGVELGSKVIVYNSLGQIVYETLVTSNKTSLDFTQFARGIYYVNAISANKNQTKKISIN